MKNKNSLFLLLFLLVFTGNTIAKPISLETAKQVAFNWFSERSDLSQFSVKGSILESKNNNSVLYIINFIPTGFVIVSADDIVVPVLGYSVDQNYSVDNHSPQFDALLENYKSQILSARKRKLATSADIQKEWDRLTSSSKSFIIKTDTPKADPLLSTNWNQTIDWNAQCPVDPLGPGGHAHAGCVAVAMAQVMKHWNWPIRGLGEFSYDHSVYGTLSANFGSSVYGWDNMPNDSPSYQIAKLLYHCGVSVKMNYSPSGSGASLFHSVFAFENYFRYDQSAEMRLKKDYTTSEWENALRLEIDNNRPVIYQGTDYSPPDTTGHAFVIDGYDGTSYFHVNWGWSGNYNDYFYLSELAPGTHDYTRDQGGIFNLFPDKIINVPSDYLTIQEALSSACEDIIIFVESGTYYENIIWPYISRISLVSLYGAENTIIDGMGQGTVIYLSKLKTDPSTSINGFTIQNGITENNGGGIYCFDSSPTISHCIITNNIGRLGGGIYSSSANVNIVSVTIMNNSAFYGGGICSFSSNLSLENVQIINNKCDTRGGGVHCSDNTIINFNGGTVANNVSEYGGGLNLDNCSSLISNVTFTNNRSNWGAGIFILISDHNIEFCTITNNNAKYSGDGIYIWNRDDNIVTIQYTNFMSNGSGIYRYAQGQINSKNCYWGHPTGPKTGLGDILSEQINYLPFLTEPDITAPPIPTKNVQVVDIGCSYVKLSWDTNPIGDLDGYKVYFNEDTTGYPYENNIDVRNVTSYTISDLIPNKPYNIAVTTYDTDGNESWYSKAIITETYLPEVQDLNIASGESSNRIVTHSPLILFDCMYSGGGEYLGQIQVSTNPTFSDIDMWNIQKTFSANATVEYNGEPLVDGVTYHLRVRVGIDDYWSEWSSLTFYMNSKPSVPDLLSPNNNVIISPEVTLKVLNSTDSENDILTYSFYVYEDSSCTALFDYTQSISEGIDTTIWTISKNLNDNSQYWWTAYANDGFEDSDESDLASFIVNFTNNFPDSFDIIYPEDSMIVRTQTPLLDWDSSYDPDPADRVNYILFLDTLKQEVEKYLLDSTSSFQITTSLKDNHVYFWKVFAQDISGASTENNGGYHTFAVNTSNDPPSPPVLIFPDSVIVESLDLIFNWNPSYDPDPYDKISYHILWTYQHLLTDSVTTDSCFCVVNNLIENGRYTWYVNANDQNGGNSQSRQRPFWVDAIPEPPKGFATISPANESAGLGSEIAFIWQESIDPDPFDLVKYDIVYTINTDDSSTYEYISEIADTTTTLNLTENGVYYWKILAYDKDQFIIPSNDDEWYVFTVGNVAIDGGLLIPVEFALHSNYPNPFNPTTTIRYDIPKATNVTLTIYNMNGQVVGRLVNQKREPGYYSVNWDAQNVSTGVYFYQIRAEGFQQVKKCLLIK